MGINLNPITKVTIVPDYGSGFKFIWDMEFNFNDPYPWVFTILAAPTPDGEWKQISPKLVNIFCWTSKAVPKVNKSSVLYFKIHLETGGGGYESDIVQPYGDLNKKEFLIAKDIMRREVLHAKQLAGVEGLVLLKANWGEKCRTCIDPITGRSRNSNCPDCIGTGYYKPYHGPYPMWMLFSQDSQHQVVESPTTGTIEPKKFTVRCIGNPILKHNDVVIDVRSGKRYYANNISILSEIRRIPIIQGLTLSEAALTDPIYKLDINV